MCMRQASDIPKNDFISDTQTLNKSQLCRLNSEVIWPVRYFNICYLLRLIALLSLALRGKSLVFVKSL